MKRKVIRIEEEKCTGCGQCIPDCPEGALQVIDGKARLVSDIFCDGLGACTGTCPEGAISVEEREAGAYDETAVMENIARQGEAVIRAHLEHLSRHGQDELHRQAVGYLRDHNIPVPSHGQGCPPGHGDHPFAGCPGAASQAIRREPGTPGPAAAGRQASELRQWPVQLALLNPDAPYFDDADLLVSADCVPFATAGFHDEFLRGRILVIFCPKLDAGIDDYIAKMARIFERHRIQSVTVLRMEVPCCGGVRYVVDRALDKSGKSIPVTGRTITIEGGVR